MKIASTSTTKLKIKNLANIIMDGDEINKSKIEKEYSAARIEVKNKLSSNKNYDFNCVYDAVYERLFGFAKAVAETGRIDYYKLSIDNTLEAYTMAAIIVMEEYMKADTSLLNNQIYEFVIICTVNPMEEDILNMMISLIDSK